LIPSTEMQKQDRARYRETLLVIVLGFTVLYLLLDRNWLLYTALAAGIAGMLSLQVNRWIHQGWFFLGEKLGFVVGKIVLGAVFIVIVLPIGLLSRLLRKDIMNLRNRGTSCYHQRDHLYRPDDLENMW
jgi:hypothetical protein